MSERWTPGEALEYAAEDYHSREYWRDNNTSHATAWDACTDETCLAIKADVERQRNLRDAVKDARNALALTYTNVPLKERPHWCRGADGYHDATCKGMQHTQDRLREF